MNEFLLSFIPIFVAMDAIGVLPMFMGFTEHLKKREREKILTQSIITAFVVGVFFLFLGKWIFKILGVMVADFKIAGGLLLLVFSIKEIFYEQPETKRIEGDFSVVPLAIPLLLGPAVLTTLLVFKGIFSLAIIALALFSNLLIGALILWYSALLSKLMGKDGMKAAGKIATILLSAIAIMLIRKGVFEMFNSRF